MSPTSSSRPTNSIPCPTARSESSVSGECTLHADTATCRSKPPRSSSTHPQFGRLYRTGDKCKIDIQTLRVHFLGRIDAQLKVRGHRVEAQAVEDILQTQFTEIEAAVLDYQNETLVAFVAAPSVCEGQIPVVTPAPAEWAARVTATLARQLPAPSVPTRIFLVDKFVMKPVSGKIDRERLPNLAHLLSNAGPETGDNRWARDTGDGEVRAPHASAGMDPGCEEVLSICRAVFETPLGLDDEFAEAGGHSILIARLAQKLQSAGWVVPVRALLSDCNTARKIASRPRAFRQASGPVAAALRSGETGAGRDEAAAEVLSIGYFTTLQFLFGMLLYSPLMLAFLSFFNFIEFGTVFTTTGLRGFILDGLLLYLLALVAPFAILLWVMTIKFFMGGDIRKNDVTPGVYPKWSRMHLRTWCIGRLEVMVLFPLRTMYRSAPLMAFVLRQLGATVGDNLQCAHDADLSGPLDLISIEGDVAISTGAYIQTTRWSGQQLHVGPVHLERGCKIGTRAAIANNVTVGRGTWITPLTSILANVGSQQIWEGAPARLNGRCTELKRTATACQYAYPFWLLETLNILMQIFLSFWLVVVPTAAIVWLARALVPAGGGELSERIFQGDAAVRDRLVPGSLLVHRHLAHRRRDLRCWAASSYAGRPFRRACIPRAGSGRSPPVQNEADERHPETVDLEHHRAVPEGSRRRALPAVWRLRVRRHVQHRPGGCYRRLPGFLLQRMFHQHARLWRRALQAAPPRYAPEFLRR